MKSSLITFESGIRDLQYYIKGLELESRLLSYHSEEDCPESSSSPVSLFQNHVLKEISAKKRLDYNMIIVSLYGCLEQFIESLIIGYLNYLNSIITTYDDIPYSIKKNHLDLSFELISRGTREKSRRHDSAENIIKKLNSCMSLFENYEINNEAFSLHSANFRIETVNDAFSRLGIHKISDKIRKHSIYFNYIIEINQNRDTGEIDSDIIFCPLNDLADRRNEVAHGVNTDQILSNELLLERIMFVDAFCRSLYEVVYSESLPFKANNTGMNLGKPIEVYNSNIVCFPIKNLRVKVGDLLLAKPANPSMPYVEGKIYEIQINSRSYEEITKDMDEDVAFRVDFKAKKNQVFFLVCQS